MRLSPKKTAAVVILAGVVLLALGSAALAAPPWSDAPDGWWVSSYGVTQTQVATVADGYPDGTFRPGAAVTRGQFAKMAVSGLGVATANPATPTFKDVGKGSTFYTHVEGAYAAQLIGGYPTSSGLYFRPDNTISRQQANSILGRYLSNFEINTTGFIHGVVKEYGTLEDWYEAEGEFQIADFADEAKLAPEHLAATAYLVFRGIVQGSERKLNPTATLVRAQAAALVLRVKAEAVDIATPPPAPTNLGVVATGSGKSVTKTSATGYVGNDATPQVTGDTLSESDIAIYDAPFFGTTPIKEDTSNSSGKFYADLDDSKYPLVDGEREHSFTSKVMNANGVVSPASAAVTYLLDTVLPTGSITAPTVVNGRAYDAAVASAKPEFTVAATDDRSGVKSVDFQVSVDQPTLSWSTISTDTTPDAGTTTYAAVWPTYGGLSGGLADGQYKFRAIITDVAGNERTLGPISVLVDTVVPTVSITAPVANSGTVFYTESTAPAFSAEAADLGSGVGHVDFLYAPWASPVPNTWAQFTLISSDNSASYAAAYAAGGLPEGHYVFAARATDQAGNESPLLDGAAYKTGVTQEVVIDGTAPVVSITAPAAGQKVLENTACGITWTLSDVTPPDAVKIEYTADGSVASPVWEVIADAAPSAAAGGSYVWTAADVTGDKPSFRLRITAVDKAGEKVADVSGHTTVALSGLFTVYDLPEAATNVTAFDPDNVNPGVDGRDFFAVWTLSASVDIQQQRVYILPEGMALALLDHHPVDTIHDNVTSTWTGAASLTRDSQVGTGAQLIAGQPYRLWIVVVDLSGNVAASAASEAFTVTAEPE